MRKVFITLFFLIFCLFLPATTRAQEVINLFQTEAKIQKDGTLEVIEYIQYDFGSNYKHGIFRKIPYITTNREGKKFALTIDVKSVIDRAGNNYKYQTSTSESTGELTIKIGDPDKTITGAHDYIINYEVYGALTYFSDHDEFYWNVTGNQWLIPIEKSQIQITLPEAIDEKDLKSTCYTGVKGSTNSDCEINVEGDATIIKATKPLSPGEGLTVVFGFPKGIVAVLEPKPFTPFWETWYGALLFWTLLIGFTILLVFWYIAYPIWIIIKWLRFGRDPKPLVGKARAWFDAPKGKKGRALTPGETGGLINEIVDLRDISATIVDLARRGFIKIEEKKKDDFYLHKKKDYVKDVTILPFERNLLSGIFKSKDAVRLKDAKLFTTVESVKGDIYQSLVDEGFFPKPPDKTRSFYIGMGILGLITGNIFLAIVCFTFGWGMPRKTQEGADAAAVATSLLGFLRSQERQLAFQGSKQMLFEKLLPYAVAFGVEKAWAERFKNIILKEPEWYSTYEKGSFNSAHFVRGITHSTSSFATAATPVTSSTGHSSGFSGGSSGGGGGGGGGGSW